MRERAVTLALAVAAFVAFLAMLRGGAPNPATQQLPRPTSVERTGGGLFALAEWLRRDGRQVVSWRESYERLANAAPAGTGHMLVVALPGSVAIETSELPALDRWVRAGNTLLVLAALADTPEWAAGGSPGFDVDALTGLDFMRREAAARAAPGGGRRRPPRPLVAAFSRRIARRHGLPAATQPPWDWLEARLGAGSTDLGELRRYCADVMDGRRIRLPLLHNLLLRLETRLP